MSIQEVGYHHLRSRAYHPQMEVKCEHVHFSVHTWSPNTIGGQTFWVQSHWRTMPPYTQLLDSALRALQALERLQEAATFV